MGDIADWCNAQMQEAYPSWNPLGRRGSPYGVVCRHCGAKRLWWFPEKRGRYLLKNPDGSQHDCRSAPASADDFEDIS